MQNVERLGPVPILKDYMRHSNNKSVLLSLRSEIKAEAAERKKHQLAREEVKKRDKLRESVFMKFKKEQQKSRDSDEMLKKYLTRE